MRHASRPSACPVVVVPVIPAAGGRPERKDGMGKNERAESRREGRRTIHREGKQEKRGEKKEKKKEEKKDRKNKPVVLSVPFWKKGVDRSTGLVCWVHSVTKKKTFRDPYI